MKSFVKFRPKQSRRRQARRFSPWQSALERLEDRTLLAAPTVENPIADQAASFGAVFEFTVPSDTFADADGHALTLTASGFPTWLTFNSATGTFSGTPTSPADAGISNITVTATDPGAEFANDAFTLTVKNAVPSFTKGADQTVLEDATAQTVTNWATNISPGLNESGQTVNFIVSNNNPGLFSVAPAISPTGTLTYTSAANQNGSATVTVFIHDNGGTSAGGVDTSVAQTFTITVTPVNDVPSFTVGADQTVLEDSGTQSVSNFATAISAGTGDTGQTVDFLVSNDTPSLFSTQPSISANGTLTYTRAANTNTPTTPVTVTVRIHDDGGTANGGVDTSAAQTFTITITGVNDAPSFTKGPDQTVLEDAGAQSITNWATNISAGPNETIGAISPAQTLEFQVSNNNTGLFSAQPSISATGELTYTPALNASGTATVTVLIRDNAGTANGGLEISSAQTFTISVTAVNDVPTFTVGPSQEVDENSGAQTVSNFATAISAGTGDSGQTVEFLVSNGNPALFSAQPAISSNGTLTYTPAANAVGVATVTVVLKDNGGTANGGVDTSAEQTFTITINAVDEPPTVNIPIADQTTPFGEAFEFAIPSNTFSDPDGDALTLSVTGRPSWLVFDADPASANPTGTFTGTPTETDIGTYNITVMATAGDESVSDTFTITVLPNSVPSFTKGANQTTLEGDGLAAVTVENWATNISAGLNESSQIGGLLFVVSTDHPEFFSADGGPEIAANGTLTYTPANDANGIVTVTVFLHDEGGTANGGMNTSAAQTFTITIINVNDAPDIAFPLADQQVFEDSSAQTVAGFVTGINPGPNESDQTVEFQLSNDRNELFSVQPTISTSGTLTYTPAPNAFGMATVFVLIHDDGGTANGGIDTILTGFTITINPVNDVPSFTVGPNLTVLEDVGAQTVTGWATNISASPANESDQVTTFQETTFLIINNDNPSLFSGQPILTNDGTLSFTPAMNMSGTANITISLRDDGGTEDGGVNTSASQTFTITVTPVNDEPSFTLPANPVNVLINSPVQTFVNFAKDISAGPNETQTVDFIVSNDNQGFFTVQPAIAANGTLTFTPAAGAFGTATVTVRIHDNGGIANGGIDTSDPTQTFTINIGAFNKGTPVSKAKAEYPTPAGAKLRAFVVDGELIVQINGVPQQFYEPSMIETLIIIGGSKNDEIDLSGLDDTAYGNLTRVVIKSNAGNDRIVGSFADDSIDAGSGNDTLSGGFGDDILIGNAGNDLLTESADEDMTLTDKKLMGGLGEDDLFTIEKAFLIGGDGGNEIDASGFKKGAVTLLGGAGNDTLKGGEKNDLILGEDGNDELSGGKGNDTVLGGFGEDTLNGDEGADLLIGGFDDDIIDGGAGRDTVAGGNGGAARGGDGVPDAGDMIMNSEVINEAFKKLFAFE